MMRFAWLNFLDVINTESIARSTFEKQAYENGIF
jgi:hypothetical protein